MRKKNNLNYKVDTFEKYFRTLIFNVGIENYKDCIKMIVRSNHDKIFSCIYYIKEESSVFFFTDKRISVQSWIDRKDITSKAEILEEAKNILTQDKFCERNCISLYDIGLLIREEKNKYFAFLNSMKDYIKSIYSCDIDVNYSFETKELSIHNKSRNYRFTISKKDDDLLISSKLTRGLSYFNDSDFLLKYKNTLLNFFDKLLEFEDSQQEYSENIIPVNSNFKVNISESSVSISVPSISFEISLNNYSYFSRNASLDYMLRIVDDLNDIFKNIFVEIEDCPQWMQSRLNEIRGRQLENIGNHKKFSLKDFIQLKG